MSEVDFEAIGRCEHIRGEIGKTLQLRHNAYTKLVAVYKSDGSGHVYDSVTQVDVNKMQEALDELKRYEAQVNDLVDEYNSWTVRAKKQALRVTKY